MYGISNQSWWKVFCKGREKRSSTVLWAQFNNATDAHHYVTKLENENPTWIVWVVEPKNKKEN